jgi:hypothetical protein
MSRQRAAHATNGKGHQRTQTAQSSKSTMSYSTWRKSRIYTRKEGCKISLRFKRGCISCSHFSSDIFRSQMIQEGFKTANISDSHPCEQRKSDQQSDPQNITFILSSTNGATVNIMEEMMDSTLAKFLLCESDSWFNIASKTDGFEVLKELDRRSLVFLPQRTMKYRVPGGQILEG